MEIQKLNLVKSDLSDIKWELANYPDGQVSITLLSDIDRKKELHIVCRIRNANELFILAQVGNILEQHQITPKVLDIKYLMAARTDRVFTLGRQALDLKIVANVINSLRSSVVMITDVHSNVSLNLINNSGSYQMSWWILGGQVPINDDTLIVFPDEGARDRWMNAYVPISSDEFHEFYSVFPNTLYCDKVRSGEGAIKRVASLKLSGLDPDVDYSKFNMYVIDDICDGGGTFMMLADAVRDAGLKPKSLNIAITHMIQENAIELLCSRYDKVSITNSYEDRKTSNYSNVTVIDVF